MILFCRYPLVRVVITAKLLIICLFRKLICRFVLSQERFFTSLHSFCAGVGSVTPVAWMVVEYLLAQARTVEMQVYLGRGYALVAEHLLYGAQVGPFEQVCGEGVAQGVRRYGLGYLRRLRQDVLL